MQISDISIDTLTSFDLNQLPGEITSLKDEVNKSDEPYIKRTLFDCEHKEVILTYWKPNQGSHIHNHGVSHGKVLVVDGEIIEKNFSYDGEQMNSINKNVFSKNTCLNISPDNFHSMTSGDQATITLHIYAPKIDKMCVYNTKTKKLESVEGGETATCDHV